MMMMISSPSPRSPTSSRVVLSDVAINQQPATPPNQKPRRAAMAADLLPSPIQETVDVIPTQQQTAATSQRRSQPAGELLYKRRNAPYQFQVIAREYLQYPPLPNTLFPYPTDNVNDAFFDGNETTPSCQPLSPPAYEIWEQCNLSYASAQDFAPAPAAVAAAAVGCFQTSPDDTNSFMVHETDASFVTPSKAPLRDFSLSVAAMGYEMDPSDVSPSLRPSPSGRRVVDNNPNESVSPVTTGPTIVLVAFGVRAEWIALDPQAPLPPLGTYVVVPGDRGKDVGLVVEHGATDGGFCDIKWRSHLPLWRMPYAAPRKPDSLPACTMFRRATAVEEARARYLRHNHQAVIAHTQAIVDEYAARTTDASFASCRVQGVESQHDNGKITVYFSADVKLRIAALAVRLFHEFKCRVWMQQVSLDGSRISTTPTRRPRNAAAA